VSKHLELRDGTIPDRLVVVRLGKNTLNENALANACERSFARWSVYAFSVLEVPNGDFERLARLIPEFSQRRQFLEADGPALLAAGFPLLPTLKHPHWSVVLSEPTQSQFQRVASHFRGPFDNPLWVGRKG